MGKRKQMTMTREQFFLHCLLKVGPPDVRTAMEFTRATPYYSVMYAEYLRRHPKGQAFTRCVVECGDAKARAVRLFREYCRWHRQQFERVKQESHDEAKKIATVQ